MFFIEIFWEKLFASEIKTLWLQSIIYLFLFILKSNLYFKTRYTSSESWNDSPTIQLNQRLNNSAESCLWSRTQCARKFVELGERLPDGVILQWIARMLPESWKARRSLFTQSWLHKEKYKLLPRSESNFTHNGKVRIWDRVEFKCKVYYFFRFQFFSGNPAWFRKVRKKNYSRHEEQKCCIDCKHSAQAWKGTDVKIISNLWNYQVRRFEERIWRISREAWTRTGKVFKTKMLEMNVLSIFNHFRCL